MIDVIEVKNLGFMIKKKKILNDINFNIRKGEFVGIIGPNGSGKSTLLKNIYKVYNPTFGIIKLYGNSIISLTNREVANKIAVVAQENDTNFDFTVEEVVSMGRYPQKKLTDTLNKLDKKIVKESIEKVEMEKFINSSFLNLSGGEKQRVLIARALAQETDIIIMDEPTNHLDIASQISALNLIKESGKTVLAALHDLSIAINYCDRVQVLHRGELISSGKPSEVINDSLIQKLYGVEAEVFKYNKKFFVDYKS